MSRFRKLSQTICQYHIMWTPKYRYRILTDQLGLDVDSCIRAFSDQLKCEITELNVQIDHVHLLVMVPPKISISDYVIESCIKCVFLAQINFLSEILK